jgi:hypothetical protein
MFVSGPFQPRNTRARRSARTIGRLAILLAWLTELSQRVDLSCLSERDRQRLADLLVVGGLMTWTVVVVLAELAGRAWLDVLNEIEDAMPVASDEDDVG